MNKINYTKYGYIDLSNMIYKSNKYIDWQKSIGSSIPFSYKGIEGSLLYLGQQENGSKYIKISYKDCEYTINMEYLKKNKLNILFPDMRNRSKNTYLNEGDIVSDYNRNLKVLKLIKKNKSKCYLVECQDCKHTYEVSHNGLINNYHGCPVCNNRIVVIGKNDFVTKHPELAKYIVNEKDKHLKCSSMKKILWKCDNCDKTYYDDIYSVLKRGRKCEFCGRKYSFGEKCMLNVLKSLNIEYKHSIKFDWSNGRIYDFYLPLYNAIIEVHGLQHYSEGFSSLGGRTLVEEIENDEMKRELAENNGISIYIVIDCRYSTIDWFKNSVLKNEKFNMIINLKDIDWNNLSVYKDEEEYNLICSLWNDKYTVTNIAKTIHMDRQHVLSILKDANKNNIIQFNEEVKKDRFKKNVRNKRSKPIRCINTNQCFQCVALCEEVSIDVFGFLIKSKNLEAGLHRKQKTNGLSFEYISKEEFNRIKLESPELVFGDSFVL